MYPWDHHRRFNSYAEYFKKHFGGRVQKLAIDAGFTCPNRNGEKGFGGCTYCDNDAFNPSYCRPSKSVRQQLEEGIAFHQKRYRRASHFLAYFQPYSNTYAPVSKLRELYEEALAFPGVRGIVVGTRPDCIDEEKLKYLKELSSKHYIAIEYGIESCYNRTLQRINRGHSFEDTVAALELTAAYGLNAGAHLIFGLPGETYDDMLAEAGLLSSLPLATVKFHQLQIIKGTMMERDFAAHPGDFINFSLEDYIGFVIDFVEKLSPKLVIERFAGEVPPGFLSGPGWGLIRNDQILKKIEDEMAKRMTWQGKKFAK